MTAKGYNGYRNRATWNVALWIANDESLYNLAVEFMRGRPHRSYRGFIESLDMQDDKTPDGFKWLGSRLCLRELNAMMREFAE